MIKVKRDVWERLLEYCALYDVEEGDDSSYQYSVRRTTGAVTIWTRQGWRDSYYVARLVPQKYNDGRKKVLDIECEYGTAPESQRWPMEKIERYTKDLMALVQELPRETPDED